MKNNKYTLKYPDGSLYDVLLNTAMEYSSSVAYSYYNKTCTYKNFLKKVQICASSLVAHGITSGDVITICMPNTPEAVIAFYAINRIGAIANIIHPLCAENEIKNYIKMSNSVMLITIDFTWDKVKNIIHDTDIKQVVVVPINYSMRIIESTIYYIKQGRKYKKVFGEEKASSWGEFLSKGKSYFGSINYEGKKDDVAAILYSGGTSGTPKGILLTNHSINALASQCIKASGISMEQSCLSIMPIFHGFGLGVCVHTFVMTAGKMIMIPQFNAKKFDRLLKEHHPHAIVGVPTLYEALITNRKLKNTNLSFIKFAISGGDTLPIPLKRRINDFFQEHGSTTKIREGYGLTECVSACCLTPQDDYREKSIGLPFPDTKIAICEVGSNKEVAVDQVGEICVSGPTVMKGYLNNEIETNKTLQVHDDKKIWLHTGDLGYKDREGFVYFVQRIKRMIISSGYNIYPSQIEEVLNSHPDVLTSTVVGIPHPYKMQVVKAYIVLKDGIESSKRVKDSIKNHCVKNISKYALPYEYEYRTSLPKTRIGKVDYRKLEEESSKEDQKEAN